MTSDSYSTEFPPATLRQACILSCNGIHVRMQRIAQGARSSALLRASPLIRFRTHSTIHALTSRFWPPSQKQSSDPRLTLILHRQSATMKRKRSDASENAKPGGSRDKERDYHLTPSVQDENGEIIWPVPKDQMAKAREVILEW